MACSGTAAMVLKQNNTKEASAELTSSSKRRRNRRKTLHKSKNSEESADINECSTQNLSDLVPNNKITTNSCQEDPADTVLADGKQNTQQNSTEIVNSFKQHSEQESKMSSKDSTKSRDDVLAAREAKKLAKQKTKGKDGATAEKVDTNKEKVSKEIPLKQEKQSEKVSAKCVDEVDRASIQEPAIASKSIVSDDQKSKDQVLAERAAKKAAKQAKKKGTEENLKPNPDMTVKDVVQTLKDIKNVAKDVQDLTAKVSAIHIEATKQTPSIEAKVNIQNDALNTEEGKSKAELKAERRAKQEAQRAAKQAAVDQKAAQAKALAAKDKPAEVKKAGDIVKEKSPKPKTDKSVKPVSASANRVNWFQHLYPEHDKEALKNIALNSNLHPAIIKLGVQLASRVVTGANARCIALFDALKKMLKDYTLPAKTEFARGFEPHLASSLDFLWAMRQPSASQTNAVKFFRHHLNQLPNNIDEFDAKKILQQEIDHYIEDQIDKAGEAISMTVQKKISTGDNILTYGCSSLIERCLREAWQAGLKFRTVIVGDRVNRAGQEMLRRLTAAGLPCIYVDMTAISYIMKSVNKVLLGAGSLLVNGCVVGLAGTAQTALAARDHNVPVLVACETHKFSDRVQTDAFVYNELGDPDALIDKSDENSPLKDWRSNPNLTPLNLTYDVTPPSLVTAVVTEKAILPCTSAPVVLRTKLTEYGM